MGSHKEFAHGIIVDTSHDGCCAVTLTLTLLSLFPPGGFLYFCGHRMLLPLAVPWDLKPHHSV